MYRVFKDRGSNSNIVIENTETKASVIIGRLTYDIINLLNERGYKAGTEDGLKLTDEWNFEVDDDTAQALMKKAMRMSKPVRDQSKKPKDILKKSNKEIDAMDVLLGLANYN